MEMLIIEFLTRSRSVWRGRYECLDCLTNLFRILDRDTALPGGYTGLICFRGFRGGATPTLVQPKLLFVAYQYSFSNYFYPLSQTRLIFQSSCSAQGCANFPFGHYLPLLVLTGVDPALVGCLTERRPSKTSINMAKSLRLTNRALILSNLEFSQQ